MIELRDMFCDREASISVIKRGSGFVVKKVRVEPRGRLMVDLDDVPEGEYSIVLQVGGSRYTMAEKVAVVKE